MGNRDIARKEKSEFFTVPGKDYDVIVTSKLFLLSSTVLANTSPSPIQPTYYMDIPYEKLKGAFTPHTYTHPWKSTT